MSRLQRGAALITALLVVALATMLATQLAARAYFDNARYSTLLEREQALQFALAAEAWASEVLIANREDGDGIDHLNELWAQPIVPPPFDDLPVQLRFQMEDLQGRINLNNLVRPDGRDDEPAMANLLRLLQILELDPSIMPAAADWIDDNIEPRFPDGAEDDYYSRLDNPYRTANQRMASPTELRLVRGVDDEAYRLLQPYITALPEATTINVNTAPPMVLRTLADGISEREAEALAEARPADGYPSVTDFLQDPALAGRDVDPQTLSVGSNYFLLRTVVELGRTEVRTETVLYRADAGTSRVILRRQGFIE
ncbi:general secretion pathway protein K [Natronocella acetinitrilica]|jgi:general secretion pathway protein K|uniref:Type II secretion system protein K n=1 Tax=Natronocella acetinitrilica TaxID=414046 RepID=A0AAE3KB08_9GAMM|nr:type II secretion system minor pseudopilin GspK [Natronocella acetinitrilica]MCP1673038.1 general secretion pathway protein K [Natronocella acetinitrilica]